MGKTLDELKGFITQRRATFTEKEIQYGAQLIGPDGEIFNHFPKRGRVVVQGNTTTDLAPRGRRLGQPGYISGAN